MVWVCKRSGIHFLSINGKFHPNLFFFFLLHTYFHDQRKVFSFSCNQSDDKIVRVYFFFLFLWMSSSLYTNLEGFPVWYLDSIKLQLLYTLYALVFPESILLSPNKDYEDMGIKVSFTLFSLYFSRIKSLFLTTRERKLKNEKFIIFFIKDFY